jgi:hypothetical protein
MENYNNPTECWIKGLNASTNAINTLSQNIKRETSLKK